MSVIASVERAEVKANVDGTVKTNKKTASNNEEVKSYPSEDDQPKNTRKTRKKG